MTQVCHHAPIQRSYVPTTFQHTVTPLVSCVAKFAVPDWNRHQNWSRVSGLPVITTRPGLNTASETEEGQFDNREYITEVIYSRSDQDSRDE